MAPFGDIGIPLIDWRHYLEEGLDMRNSHQSFASRQQMLHVDADASNQVVWFTDARQSRESDPTPEAGGRPASKCGPPLGSAQVSSQPAVSP